MRPILLPFDPEHHVAVYPFVIRDRIVGIRSVDPDGRYWRILESASAVVRAGLCGFQNGWVVAGILDAGW